MANPQPTGWAPLRYHECMPHHFYGRVLSNHNTLRVVDAFHPTQSVVELVNPAGEIPSVDAWVEVLPDGQVHPLAQPNSARAKILHLAAKKAFNPLHSKAVLAEAGAWESQPGIDDDALVDRRALPFVTIDEPTSMDLDQALCIQRQKDGWVVWYAIADAAWFAQPKTAIFAEALHRGATCYLPGLVVPMMPKVLSEGLCSLNPNVDRRALLFRIVLAEDGTRQQCTIERARIRSRAKLTYDGVDGWLKGQQPLGCTDPAVAESLHGLEAVGKLRIDLAVERDVIRLRRVESAVGLDGDDGLRFVAFSDPRNDVERYNEQISLLCNMEGAQFLMEDTPAALRPVFRVHPAPSPSRLSALRAQIDDIVAVHQLPQGWRWSHQSESLADYLDRLPRGGREGRLARAIHRQAMMSNGRSTFTAVPGLHHGVGADAYARFSAPMREVVGVYVHRQCWRKLAGATAFEPGETALQEAVIAASNTARSRQRSLDHETNRLVLDQLFAEDLDRQKTPRRNGTIMGLTRSKIHVQLDGVGIDVKVYRHHMEKALGETLTLRSPAHMASAQHNFRLGQAVYVEVMGRETQPDRWALFVGQQ